MHGHLLTAYRGEGVKVATHLSLPGTDPLGGRPLAPIRRFSSALHPAGAFVPDATGPAAPEPRQGPVGDR